MKAEELVALIEQYIEESKVVSKRRVVAVTNRENYKEVLKVLKGQGIQHLTTITGVDVGKEVEVIYHVDCGDGVLLDLKLRVPKKALRVDTVTDILPSAVLYERELMDMLGVKVRKHPDPRRIFLPEDWPKGEYPLRREWKGVKKK